MDKHKQGDWGMTQIRTHSILMAELSRFFFTHEVMRPFGSRIKYDTHSWDQTEDVAGSMFRLSSSVRLCLALSQPSQPPHAELHAAMSHHTNISLKLDSHQTDNLFKLCPSTSTTATHTAASRGSLRRTHFQKSLRHRDVKNDRGILGPFWAEPGECGPAELIGSHL